MMPKFRIDVTFDVVAKDSEQAYLSVEYPLSHSFVNQQLTEDEMETEVQKKADAGFSGIIYDYGIYEPVEV